MATNSGRGYPIAATEGAETRDIKDVVPPLSPETKAGVAAEAELSPIHSTGQQQQQLESDRAGDAEELAEYKSAGASENATK